MLCPLAMHAAELSQSLDCHSVTRSVHGLLCLLETHLLGLLSLAAHALSERAGHILSIIELA